jgi:hypothetical protein
MTGRASLLVAVNTYSAIQSSLRPLFAVIETQPLQASCSPNKKASFYPAGLIPKQSSAPINLQWLTLRRQIARPAKAALANKENESMLKVYGLS